MTATVAVVTDSAASLPAALAHKWGIRVVPLQVIVDGVSYSEGAEITPEEVLEHLVVGRTVTTSQPSAATFEAAYAEAVAAGASAIVAVMISGKLSGTASVAQAAAHAVAVPVTVVDSGTVAMATGYAALGAAALAATGASDTEVAEEARRVAASSICMFTVDSLEYLRRGGRISPAVAAVGRVLGVRPVLEVVDGEVALVSRVRTTARARAALVARVDQAISERAHPALAVMALGDADYGDDAARVLETAHPQLAMTVRTPVSAVLSAHGGPGALAAVVVDLPEGVL
jgi:DegV family protein with EDD domain